MWCFFFPFLVDKTVISNGCSSTCICCRPFHSCTRHSKLTSSAIVNFVVRKLSVVLLAADLMVWDHRRQDIIWKISLLCCWLWSWLWKNETLKSLIFVEFASQEGRGMFIRFLIWFTQPEIQQVQLNSLSLEWQDKPVKLSELLKFG